MKSLISYFTFNGKCREALHFYAACIGGELNFQPIGDSAMAQQNATKMKERILDATLTNRNVVIMAADMSPQNGMIKGKNVSLILDCSSELEIKTYNEKLLMGGDSNHPLEDTFWSAIFGDLTDKFGNHWLLNYTRETHKN